jgi:pentatricopeptide repeat protein
MMLVSEGTKIEEEKSDTVKEVEVDLETRQKHALRIKGDMDARNLPLNATAYTALIRMLAKAHRVEEADALLCDAEATQQCKMRLRLYSSFLSVYCELGYIKCALDS